MGLDYKSVLRSEDCEVSTPNPTNEPSAPQESAPTPVQANVQPSVSAPTTVPVEKPHVTPPMEEFVTPTAAERSFKFSSMIFLCLLLFAAMAVVVLPFGLMHLNFADKADRDQFPRPPVEVKSAEETESEGKSIQPKPKSAGAIRLFFAAGALAVAAGILFVRRKPAK